VAAAENAPVPYEADSAVHSRLAIRISEEKCCEPIFKKGF
jgi:hypothetical protein